MMGGKTTKYVLTSGLESVSSGLATAFSIDGRGEFRHLNILNDSMSGTVTICVYVDSGLIITYGTASLVPNGSVFDVDIIGSSLQGSGTILFSGSPSTNQSLGFTNNLTVQYMKTSGTVTLTGIVDINKSIMPT